jgi:dUTP pyrophosphatase
MRRFEAVSKYSSVTLPKRATISSAGYDLAVIEESVIGAKKLVMVPTGVKALFPSNEVLLIIARSSLLIKHGLMLPNGVGVIDSDYYNNPRNEGEIFILLYNLRDIPVILQKGELIAQGIFLKYSKVSDENGLTRFREGGFGSTSENR